MALNRYKKFQKVFMLSPGGVYAVSYTHLARTIADLDGAVKIGVPHISEAICFRSADKSIWRI